jgi:hypothetical protein
MNIVMKVNPVDLVLFLGKSHNSIQHFPDGIGMVEIHVDSNEYDVTYFSNILTIHHKRK